MAVAAGTPMERSIARTYADLILWMEQDYGISRRDGYNLYSQLGTFLVGCFAIGTVATQIRMEYIEGAAP